MARVWSRLAVEAEQKGSRTAGYSMLWKPVSLLRELPWRISWAEDSISLASRDHTCAICSMAALVCESPVLRAISKQRLANQRYPSARPILKASPPRAYHRNAPNRRNVPRGLRFPSVVKRLKVPVSGQVGAISAEAPAELIRGGGSDRARRVARTQ